MKKILSELQATADTLPQSPAKDRLTQLLERLEREIQRNTDDFREIAQELGKSKHH